MRWKCDKLKRTQTNDLKAGRNDKAAGGRTEKSKRRD